MDKLIWALKKPAGKAAKFCRIDNTLESLQEEVGGYIEAVNISPDLAVICDEDGRLKGKPYNCKINGVDFVGDIVICGRGIDDFIDIPTPPVMHQRFPHLWEEAAT